MLFSHYLIIDWSAASRPTRAGGQADAIWLGHGRWEGEELQVATRYFRTRHACMEAVTQLLHHIAGRGERVLVGFDFVYAFPRGLAAGLGLTDEVPWRATWKELHRLMTDDAQNRNNRFAVAAALNERLTGTAAPFWGYPGRSPFACLQPRRPFSFPLQLRDGSWLQRRRATELPEPLLAPVWKLCYPASVGGQTLTGIPYLYALRFLDEQLAPVSRFWPCETGFTADFGASLVIHAEIWPGILRIRAREGAIKDEEQVRELAYYFGRADRKGELADLLECPAGLTLENRPAALQEEGWILGLPPVTRNAGQ